MPAPVWHNPTPRPAGPPRVMGYGEANRYDHAEDNRRATPARYRALHHRIVNRWKRVYQ